MITANDFVMKICNAIGVDPSETAGVKIILEPGNIAYIEVKQAVDGSIVDRVVALTKEARDSLVGAE